MVTHLMQWALSNTLLALLLALPAAACGLLGRRPALAHALWMLVLVKLFTPSLFSLPVGPRVSIAPAAAAVIVPGLDAPAPAGLSAPASASQHENPIGSQSTAFDPADRLSPGNTPPNVLAASAAFTWLLGSLICAGIAWLRIARFNRALADAAPAPGVYQAESDEAARQLRLTRSPGVWMLPGRITPMLWAHFSRPRVLVPGELWGRLSPEQRRTLLLHELAHLKRRDHWARWVELAATVIFWWDPVVWWARSQLRQAEEQCCDAWVTWAQAGGEDDYSAALVEVIDFASRRVAGRTRLFGSSMPALATGVSRFRNLSRRLQMIDRGTNHRGLGIAGIACICAVMVMLPVSMVRRGQAEVAKVSRAGDPLAERSGKAVEKGLGSLAGHLPLPGGKQPADESAVSNRTAILSLCGMAFLASGSDLHEGPYHAQLEQCLDAVLADCHDDGLIASNKAMAAMYHQGYATLFLAEIYRRTHDERIRAPLEKAVTLIEKSQNAAGAWRYLPVPGDGDVSVTACVLNGLLAAKSAGIEVRPDTIKAATEYVLSCKQDDGGYIYMAGQRTASGPARTAAAAAVLHHAGGQPDSVAAAVKFLEPILGGKNGSDHESYMNYYASQFLPAVGDEAARESYRKLSESIIARQSEDGSWDYHGVSRTYDTACALLALQANDARLWTFSGK